MPTLAQEFIHQGADQRPVNRENFQLNRAWYQYPVDNLHRIEGNDVGRCQPDEFVPDPMMGPIQDATIMREMRSYLLGFTRKHGPTASFPVC